MAWLSSYKRYDVHSVTTRDGDRRNANIATWVMQSALKARYFTVALAVEDYTIELVEASGVLNVNLLARDQIGLVRRFGKKSGRDVDKLDGVDWADDDRGVPYLTGAVGYIMLEVEGWADSGDHRVATCRKLHQHVLHGDKAVLTYADLKDEGVVG